MSTTTPLRLVPLRAWKALAALQEPLPQAQLHRRLDKALAALCQALAAPLPEASGLYRHEAATLPDAESFAYYAKALDGLRFYSASLSTARIQAITSSEYFFTSAQVSFTGSLNIS
jgi:hypothetical protein